MAQHNDVGKWGERYALDILDREGYILIETDWRPPRGHRDLDIIAYTPDRRVMVFIEVKTRSRKHDVQPEDAVDRKKILNLQHAANQYIKLFNVKEEIRFDIISIIGDENRVKSYEHIVDAFNPNLL